MRHHLRAALGSAALLLLACDPASPPAEERCTTHDECAEGLCVDGRCATDPIPPGTDAGPAGADAGPPGADTDGDGIGDFFEGSLDTDGDGVPDVMDDDSDGDGWLDAEESGDGNPSTPPPDSDGDGTPDFRDLDSDDDGLGDAAERMAGTDPRAADTDGDGADDLVESVAGTDPTDPTSNPRGEGDFYFIVPHERDPVPPRDTLVFEATIRKADVFFVIDTSHSMDGYINNVRANIRDRIAPGLTAAIADVQLGVGQFDVAPEDASIRADRTMCTGIRVDATSTAELGVVEAALDMLTANCGTDEPYAQALWLFATGDTARWPMLTPSTCAPGEIGYGCARPDAVLITVLIGDEDYWTQSYRRQERGTGWAPTTEEIVAAYREIGGKVVVLGPTVGRNRRGHDPHPYVQITTETGSVDGDGDPLVFESATDDTVADAAIEAITALAGGARLEVGARAVDLDDDGVDATGFIDRLEPNVAGGVVDPTDATRVCVAWPDVADRDGDGFADVFVGVPSGTPVCFDVIAAINRIVEPSDEPQIFRAAIEVVGDGRTVLDTREVFFLVPPAEIVIM